MVRLLLQEARAPPHRHCHNHSHPPLHCCYAWEESFPRQNLSFLVLSLLSIDDNNYISSPEIDVQTHTPYNSSQRNQAFFSFFVGSLYSSWDEILVDTMEDCIAGEWEWEEKEYEINTPTERGVRQGRGTTTVTYAREASR